MAILNVTPDSFSPSSRALDPAAALEAALRMEAEGADLIDLGAESTRPGADPIDAETEIARLVPALRAIVPRVRVPISVDTSKATVARAAVDAGASIINDVSGLGDAAMAGVAAASGAALVLMHGRGPSKSMYDRAAYGDLVLEITSELKARMALATAGGVPLERVIVDPGIGFAKRVNHSYGVLARLAEIARTLDRPLLVGPSRKSFLADATRGRSADERDWGTAAAVAAAVLNGAHAVRVHAVAEMVQVVRVAEAIRSQC
jgi:dihydropteroate synthase